MLSLRSLDQLFSWVSLLHNKKIRPVPRWLHNHAIDSIITSSLTAPHKTLLCLCKHVFFFFFSLTHNCHDGCGEINLISRTRENQMFLNSFLFFEANLSGNTHRLVFSPNPGGWGRIRLPCLKSCTWEQNDLKYRYFFNLANDHKLHRKKISC